MLVRDTAHPDRVIEHTGNWARGIVESDDAEHKLKGALKKLATKSKSDPELDSWKVDCDSTCHYIGAVARPKRMSKAGIWSREDAMERFLRKYSNGFTDASLPFVDSATTIVEHLAAAIAEARTAGTIVVDTQNTYLYYVLGGGKAIRYGIGVGREGFTWAGTKTIERKAEWPDWTPPPEMRKRHPELPEFVAGGSPKNPLGPRAMYLHRDGVDTGYRFHGTLEPWSIGKDASSGCIRMFNEDAIDLYQRCPIGTAVQVLPHIADQAESPTQVSQTTPVE